MGLNKDKNKINSPMFSQAYKDKLKAEADKKASAIKARVDYSEAKGQVDKLKKDVPKQNDKPLVSGTSFGNSKGDLIPLESAEGQLRLLEKGGNSPSDRFRKQSDIVTFDDIGKTYSDQIAYNKEKQKEREAKKNVPVKSNPGGFSFNSNSPYISENDVLRLGKGPLSEGEQINQGVYNNKSQKDEKTLAKLSLSLSNAANNKSSDPVVLEKQFRYFKNYLDDYKKDYGKLPAGYDALYDSVEKIISDYEKSRAGHSISAGGEMKKENFGSWLLKNAAAGLASFNQAFGATLNLISPELFGGINEYYKSENEKYSRKALNASLAMGKGYDSAGSLVQATVNALPAAVLAVLSGGSSVASSLGSSGGMISGFVTSAAKNPSFWLSAFQSMGNEYERAKSLGANDFVASSAAIISSLLNAGVEVSGGIETLLPGLKNGNASTVRQWIQSMVEEGGEEAVQSIIQKSISKIMYDKEIKNISLTDENAVVSGKGMLGDFIGGAVVGGFLGGGTIGADYVANAISDIRGPRFESFVKNDAFYHVKNARKFLRRDLIAMDTVARNFGVKIEIVDSLYDEHGDFANGQFSADGKTLYISKESKDPLTLTFIHESVHALKANDPEAYKAILEDLKKTVGTNTKEYRDVVSALRSSYRKHLNGTKSQNKNLIDEEFTAATLSHLLANPKSLKFIAQSDMNRLSRIADNVFSLFDGNIRRFKNAEGDAAKLFEPVVKRIEAKRKQFEKAYVEAGGEVQGTLSSFNGKYSIVSLPNGMKYVKANEQVIKSSDPELWEQEIIDYVNKTVRKGQDVEFFLDDGDILKITGRTAWKLGDKGSLSDELYFVKGNASGVIDEIVQVSSYKKSKPPLKKHRNGFAKKGFDYRRAFFEDLDGSYYRLSISVGINEDGKEVYNIGRIEKEDHIPRKRLNGLNMGNRSSDNRISDNNDIVNSKKSLPIDNDSKPSNSDSDLSKFFKNAMIERGGGGVDEILQKNKISLNMSDDARYEILKDKFLYYVTLKSPNTKKLSSITKNDIKKLKSKYKKEVVPILKKIADEFNVAGKTYHNDDIELSFEFSKSSLRESIFKQKKNYYQFANMLTIFDDIIESAIGIEVHSDKYKDTRRADPDLKQTYVLVSAFREGFDLIPVRLTIKEFEKNKKNKLHVAICTDKIEDAFFTQASYNDRYDFLRSASSRISLSYLFHNVNDEDLVKYIPGKFRYSTNSNVISEIIRRASIRYGLGDADSEAVKTISFAQKDIDERKGWNFRFEDNTVRSQIQDKHNNSLHLSDSVIFEMNDSGNVSYGTGRIIDFLPAEVDYDFANYQNSDVSESSKYDAIVAIDSGVGFTDTIRVPGRNLMFVAHNTAETVSNDFSTANIMYSRAKNAFDALGRSGDINALKTFSFADAQYYLLHTSQKLNMLAGKIRRDMARDEGITDEHYSVMHSDGNDSNPFDYAFQSPYDMTMQMYDAVRNYNLAKDICDIYIATGASVVDFNRLVASLQDTDAILPYKRTRSQRSKNSPNYQKSYVTNNSFANGNYMFNDLERNFERVFGNHYDVVKPLIDNFNRAKGAYSRNLMGNVSVLVEMCREYDFEPGDDFDIAIQAYGEGSLHLDLNKSSDMRIFKRMGYNPAYYASSNIVDVYFGYANLVSRFGEVKAEQIKHCAESFRVMYDDYLKRANETIAKIYPGQPDRLIKPRKDYFRHFKDIGDDLFSLGFALSENIQIDPELAGISDRTKPNQSFESYRQMREGKSTGYSAIKGFLEYMQQAEYTIQINPFIKEFRELRQTLAHAKSQQGSDDLNSFLIYLDKFSNHIAKKTIGVDRIFTDFMGKSGRSFLSGISKLNNKAMSNAVVGNFGVSVKQILNLKNGIFYLQNPNLLVNATYGLARAVSNPELMEHYDSLFEQSNYLAERYLDLSFAERKSSARKVAENIVSIGDEFACRAIWLAAYEDGLRLGANDPVIYADDIAKKCSAGRGIGEKPLAFTEQSVKLTLSFLLENNNNWNVLRDFFSDTVKQRGNDDHVFGDKNSYKYYKHNQTADKKVFGNSFKLATFLLATVGINDLLEELLGFRAEFDVINNFRHGFSEAYKKNSNNFDLKMFFDGMLRSAKYTGIDFAEHRNFSQVYAAMLDWVTEDNPLDSNNEFFGNMPVLSIVSNTMKKGFKDGDLLGAGFELGTGLLMPYGGGQVKKTTKGLFDFAQGGHYKTPFTEIIAGKPKGGLSYEVEQSRGNFMRGALFGSSAFPGAREYYDGIDDYYEKKSEDDKLRKKAYDDFVSGFYTRSGTGFEGELSRLLDKSGADYALPYDFLDKEVIYDDLLGNEQTVTLSEDERKKYNDDLIRKLSDAYRNVVNSDKYKNTDDDGKLLLLKKEHSKISGDFAEKIKNSFRFKSEIDEYVAAHGEDDAVKFYKKEGNIDYLPFYYPDRNQKRSFNNKTYNFELSDEQLRYYSEISQQQIEKEYGNLFNGEGWAGLSDEKKSEKLLKVREKAIDDVGNFIKYDYVYKDAMKKYDSEHGADNAIRKAYEYSHDATVYPFYELNDKIKFTYKSVSYEYELSREKDSYHNGQVEYDAWMEYYNGLLEQRYAEVLTPCINSNSLSDDELYELIRAYKKRVMDDRLNIQLRNYAKGRLGLPEYSYQKVK